MKPVAFLATLLIIALAGCLEEPAEPAEPVEPVSYTDYMVDTTDEVLEIMDRANDAILAGDEQVLLEAAKELEAIRDRHVLIAPPAEWQETHNHFTDGLDSLIAAYELGFTDIDESIQHVHNAGRSFESASEVNA